MSVIVDGFNFTNITNGKPDDTEVFAVSKGVGKVALALIHTEEDGDLTWSVFYERYNFGPRRMTGSDAWLAFEKLERAMGKWFEGLQKSRLK